MDAKSLYKIACAAWMESFLLKAERAAKTGGTKVCDLEPLLGTAVPTTKSFSKGLLKMIKAKGFTIVTDPRTDAVLYISFVVDDDGDDE